MSEFNTGGPCLDARNLGLEWLSSKPSISTYYYGVSKKEISLVVAGFRSTILDTAFLPPRMTSMK